MPPQGRLKIGTKFLKIGDKYLRIGPPPGYLFEHIYAANGGSGSSFVFADVPNPYVDEPVLAILIVAGRITPADDFIDSFDWPATAGGDYAWTTWLEDSFDGSTKFYTALTTLITSAEPNPLTITVDSAGAVYTDMSISLAVLRRTFVAREEANTTRDVPPTVSVSVGLTSGAMFSWLVCDVSQDSAVPPLLQPVHNFAGTSLRIVTRGHPDGVSPVVWDGISGSAEVSVTAGQIAYS